VLKGTEKIYWLYCSECGHDFDTKLCYITRGGCPYCAGKRLCKDMDCKICFKKSFLSVLIARDNVEWNRKKNREKPRYISKGSSKKYWLKCTKCKHDFDITPKGFTSGHNCSYCTNQKLCDNDDCKTCYNKSFASHPNSIHWNYGLNDIEPRGVFRGSAKKYWFSCSDCPHDFDLSPINNEQGRWCPYCSNRKLCNSEKCTSCYNNSFACHPTSELWDYNKNKVKPRDIFLGSDIKYWFLCDKCSHSFLKDPNHINSEEICPYCAHKKLCKDYEWCMYCYDNSFASHPKSEFWDYNKNKLTPRQVFKCSDNKHWFICEKHGSFQLRLAGITCKDYWCFRCKKSKGERKITEYLSKRGIFADEQKTFDDLISTKGCKLRYDVYFTYERREYIIEYDGEQHFYNIEFFDKTQTLEERQKRDLQKTEYCKNNNIYLLRISYNYLNVIEKIILDFLVSEKKV
jgi:DNA-directed RNA polymerase subunit RPC12/RpoP